MERKTCIVGNHVNCLLKRMHDLKEDKCTVTPVGDYVFDVPWLVMACSWPWCLLSSFEAMVVLMNVGSSSFELASCSSSGSRVVAYFVETYHCDLQCEEKYTDDCWYEVEGNWL